MTENSYICQLIRDNPDDWEDIIKKKDLYVKREASERAEYAIFNYDVSADFSDPVVREASMELNMVLAIAILFPTGLIR